MIKPLRKYHFFIWRILAIVLPVIFTLSLLFRPDTISNYDHVKNDFSFDVKKLTTTTAQVTVELKNSLQVPSCLVYISSDSKDVLLGKVTHRGAYRFEIPIDQENVTVKLYNAIHKKEIMQTELTINNK
jgi:hypothetical protein